MNPRNKPTATLYTEAQSRHWLAWLARGMMQHGQTVFLIEQLQPSWLTTRWQSWIYILMSRSLWSLMVGLVIGLIAGPIGGLAHSLSAGLNIGFSAGLIYVLNDMLHVTRRHSQIEQPAVQIVWKFVVDFLIVGLIGGLIMGISYTLRAGLSAGPIIGLICGPIWTIRRTSRTRENEILTIETLTWSWANDRMGSLRRLNYGLSGGLSGGLIGALQGGLIGALVGSLTGVGREWILYGLIAGVVGGLVGGLTPRIQELKTRPNQGIRLAIRNGLLVGGVIGIAVGVIKLIVWPMAGAESALAYGVLSVLCFGLWYGGLDVLQHGILRLLLYGHGDAPFKYARFLDYASDELNFLQKVGGGYVFIHRYLLEHFAAMEETSETDQHRTPTNISASGLSASDVV